MIKFVKTVHKNLLDPTGGEKTYASSQVAKVLTLEDFAKHISSHNSKYGKGDIMCVLTEAVECMREQLLNGNKVMLGDLGGFWLALKSRGVCESEEDENGDKPVFTAKQITGINVKWYKGPAFDSFNMMKEAQFEEVLSRKAARAALKEKSEQIANGTYNPSAKPGGEGNANGAPNNPNA